MSTESLQEKPKEQGEVREAPLWMWGIAFLGLVLVLGSIGFALYEAAAGDSSPPDVTMHVDEILPASNGFLVTFRAVNEGGSAAKGLVVEAELKNGAESVEMSSTVIEFLPSHSERGGGFFFASDPRQHDLQLRAKGYETT